MLNRRVANHEEYDDVVLNEPAGEVSLHTDIVAWIAANGDRRRCGVALRYLAADVRVASGSGIGPQHYSLRDGDPSSYWPNELDQKKTNHKMALFVADLTGIAEDLSRWPLARTATSVSSYAYSGTITTRSSPLSTWSPTAT